MEATILPVTLRSYLSWAECYKDLQAQGCKNLGWLNNPENVIPDNLNCVTAYKNWSGSSTVMVDLNKRVFYSVDMGD